MKLTSVTLRTFGCLIKIQVVEVGKILLTKAFQLSWIVLAASVKKQGWFFKLYCASWVLVTSGKVSRKQKGQTVM